MATMDGNTPLHQAVIDNRRDLVTRLVDQGADLDHPNDLGLSSRQLALFLRREEMRDTLSLPPLPFLWLQKPGVQKPEKLTVSEFEQTTGIRYCQQIHFPTYSLLRWVARVCRRSCSQERMWRGITYHQQIHSLVHPRVSIRWLDQHLGFGLFTEEPLDKDQLVGLYTGLMRWRGPLWGCLWGRLNDYTFRYTIEGLKWRRLVIDAEREGNHTRFLNHSDHPNLLCHTAMAEGLIHILFTAKDKVPAGTQLSFDYGDLFWGDGRLYEPIL